MSNPQNKENNAVDRRSFMKSGLIAGGAAAVGATLLSNDNLARAQERSRDGRLNEGDIAILRFLAAAEIIESDLWVQYAELGGLTSGVPIEVNPTPNPPLNSYQMALSNLDGDGPQYITSNTLDEVSHARFLNNYLASKGAKTVNFDKFRTLPGSSATGSSGIKRLTNLTNLTVDTSWFVRYRSKTNPDNGTKFPQAITLENVPAIPVTNADLDTTNGTDHIQVIANIAGFHFGYIEQGGTSLYAAMSQKVNHPEVLRITLSIGGDEIAHFLEWVDFAGNAVQPTVAPVTDPQTGITFPNFFDPLNPLIQPSLIFPVPCEFIDPALGDVAIIRPTTDKFGGAVATIASFTADGLFIDQNPQFLEELQEMAEAADAAFRF